MQNSSRLRIMERKESFLKYVLFLKKTVKHSCLYNKQKALLRHSVHKMDSPQALSTVCTNEQTEPLLKKNNEVDGGFCIRHF